MKQIIFSLAIMLTSILANAQQDIPANRVNYEAANWKTWLLDSAQQIKIVATPTIAQSKVELKTIQQRLDNLDERKSENIKYWNAGAPSYRWNQIVIDLLAQKFDVQLRMPASWMNIAIYDATILAWREKLKYKRQRPNVFDPS